MVYFLVGSGTWSGLAWYTADEEMWLSTGRGH